MILQEYVNTNQSQFVEKVRHIAGKLDTLPEYLMAVMYFESGLDHRAQNPYGSATGLIQFLSSTATQLGTSTAALLQMSNVEQLDYVYEYLKPYRGKLDSLEDVYLAVFYPAAMGKPDNYQVGSPQTARVNPVFDLDKNQQITVGEIRQALKDKLPQSVFETIKKKKT